MLRAAILAFCLSSCAVQPMWVLAEHPVPVEHVVRVDFPGGKVLDGFANRPARTIEIKKGLSAAREKCVYDHEAKHMRGWWHTVDESSRGYFMWDCGDYLMEPR